MALIDLDAPPRWWDAAATDTLTADQARALAGTKGVGGGSVRKAVCMCIRVSLVAGSQLGDSP